MRTLRMTIEYDGAGFSGWQKQPGEVRTVQGEIEGVLARVLREPVVVHGAGRTDAGVHARGQVASFTTSSGICVAKLSHALNGLLPQTVRIRGMNDVPGDFHARFSALGREYRYFFAPEPTAFGRYAACFRNSPDLELLNRCSSELVGTHDFRAFCRESRDSPNAVCTVYGASWSRSGEQIVFRISANRFLRTMVRFLVSAILEARRGDMTQALEKGMFPSALVPADPSGLFLWRVYYP
ncbi:tRNA pseudouridine(38-40) synthase TruA [Prosthecochloris sp. GSB1]|uniref:tRNA pseudouridine(38-40) synthase TruA n=1 Tax=Prosthecochloris sp. GSB1 TaxID=281093 RepID=UPI001EED2FE5|nr:tRNA pseudouridine(38-40) synthase TruA [Prosthecochloris sp. GSB1]